MRRGQIPLIIEDLDVYPQHPCPIGAPTLNSEEPVMGSAALPDRAGQVRSDRVLQTRVGITGDEADPGQPAGDEIGGEVVDADPVSLVATRRPRTSR